jgi:predicted HicB family RNase H-like nuclease
MRSPSSGTCGTIGSVKEDVHVRIDKDVMTAVRVYAATQRITLAAAVEALLHQALNGGQS